MVTCVIILPIASFDMKISVDGLFFIGSQLVALSYTGKVAVWQSMTQHWQVLAISFYFDGVIQYDVMLSALTWNIACSVIITATH